MVFYFHLMAKRFTSITATMMNRGILLKAKRIISFGLMMSIQMALSATDTSLQNYFSQKMCWTGKEGPAAPMEWLLISKVIFMLPLIMEYKSLTIKENLLG